MKRSTVTRLALAAILVASVAWLAHLRTGGTSRPAETAVTPGPGFGPIVALTFRSAAGDSVVVRRQGTGYWIVHPLHDRADAEFLSEVERQIRQLKPERVFSDSLAGRFGLLPPARSVRALSREGRLWEVALGDTSPVGSAIYARTGGPGGPVVLVDLFTSRKWFAPTLDVLRDKTAASLQEGPVDSVRAEIPGRALRATRLPEDRWLALEPRGLEIEPGRMRQLLQTLRGPMISGFPEASVSKAELGLDPPRALWVLYQGERAETVRVGRVTPDVQSVYILPAGRTQPAMLKTDFFRLLVDGWAGIASCRLIRAAPDSVQEIDFLDGPRGLGYLRENGAWISLPGRVPVVNPRILAKDVNNLAVAQWRRYPVEDIDPGSAPRFRLRLATAARAETLTLAAVRDTVILARSTAARRWGPVPPDLWSAWQGRGRRP